MTQLPVLISRNNVIFPHCNQTLEVARNFSLNAIQLAIEKYGSQMIVVTQKRYSLDNPKGEDFFHIGTLSKVKIVKKNADKSILVEITGVSRVHIEGVIFQKDLEQDFAAWFCQFSTTEEVMTSFSKSKRYIEIILDRLSEVLNYDETKISHIRELVEKPRPRASLITDKLSDCWPTQRVDLKQRWLSEFDVLRRLRDMSETEIVSPQIKELVNDLITKKVNRNISKQQKEFYLKEKMKIIKEELGEISSKDVEIANIKKRLKSGGFPPKVASRIKEELNRFEYSSSMSGENAVIRGYIDWLLNLPWMKESADSLNFEEIEGKLHSKHSALKEIKERILEYIAVRIQKKSETGSIICFVGPPGVGKTSLAQSIADALGKEFVKVSLAGIHDESELKGHRKTYIGSMPGRIIKGLKQAKVKNPLFLLDEVDKMGHGHGGDPVNVFLEIFDPKLNKTFSDNYIEEEFDLSKVMFVLTANYLEHVPQPLLDRLEIIELSSYTELEKLEICKKHLIEEVFSDHNLQSKDFKITDDQVLYIINKYTREAGVRALKRCFEKIVRKVIKERVSSKSRAKSIKVDDAFILKYLGQTKYDNTEKGVSEMPGVVNGLAYTECGGDLLPIEVNFHAGKGGLNLTGNLKKTMQESANVALAFVKQNMKKFGLNKIDWSEIDINLHVPTGGVPKDGPSAGITIVTALISSLQKCPVDTSLAMTGEITLRGKVLPIGGLREKVISAARGGVTKVFIPVKNEKDIEKIPEEIVKKIEILTIENYFDLYGQIFPLKKPSRNS